MPESSNFAPTRSQGLVDVLDRILDKGLVIAGDVRVNLANVELLTIHVRLLVCSIDKAEKIGLTWWKTDPMLSGDVSSAALERENSELRARIHALETSVQRLTAATAGASVPIVAPESQETEATSRRSGGSSKAARKRPDAG